MDEKLCINIKRLNILNVCDYIITYFQCYLSVLSFCLVRQEISREHRTTVQTCDTYIHTYIHTCMHAYIHTYVHTYIHTGRI